jgi:hypothetical protein
MPDTDPNPDLEYIPVPVALRQKVQFLRFLSRKSAQIVKIRITLQLTSIFLPLSPHLHVYK